MNIPWRREWQPTPVLLPGKSHGQRNLAGYSPWGCKEANTTERLTFTFVHTGCLALLMLRIKFPSTRGRHGLPKVLLGIRHLPSGTIFGYPRTGFITLTKARALKFPAANSTQSLSTGHVLIIIQYVSEIRMHQTWTLLLKKYPNRIITPKRNL